MKNLSVTLTDAEHELLNSLLEEDQISWIADKVRQAARERSEYGDFSFAELEDLPDIDLYNMYVENES